MEAENIYAGSVLPEDGRTIRVLHLQPGKRTDPVQGTLRLLDLYADSRSPYECLSYVWGDQSQRKTAIINNTNVTITENLHVALCYIRSQTREVIIWADALCINQLDNDEKSQQVALMGLVYGRCSKAYLWLGLPDESSLKGNPFAFLEHWVNGRHFYELPGFARDDSSGEWTWEENETCKHLLNDFQQVTASLWFTRAWTVQECLLPEDSLVMFGDWTISWDLMVKAEIKKASHGDGAGQCCQGAVNAFKPPQMGAINNWMYHPGRGRHYMDVVRSKSQPPPFYQGVLAFSSRHCTNPLDKIYSLLCLATHPVYDDFKPDYNADVPTVYMDIFTRMIRETNGDFACFMGGGFGSIKSELPSWVRDFYQIRPLGVIGVEERRIWNLPLFHASENDPAQPVWNEKKELRYEGTYADTVKSVAVLNPTMDVALASVFNEWLELCKETMGPSKSSTLRDTFSRIICSDVCMSSDGVSFRRARETDFPDEDVWLRIMNGDLYAAEQRGYGWGLYFGMSGRCFFTTTSGRMGLCQPNTKPGDEVWIMRGVSVPFTLRPQQRTQSGIGEQYAMLGDCFLHGIMDGELGGREKLDQRHIVMI